MNEKDEEKEKKEDLNDFLKSVSIPKSLSVSKGTVVTLTAASEEPEEDKKFANVSEILEKCFSEVNPDF